MHNKSKYIWECCVIMYRTEVYRRRGYSGIPKRILDIAVALAGLFIGALPMIICAAAIINAPVRKLFRLGRDIKKPLSNHDTLIVSQFKRGVKTKNVKVLSLKKLGSAHAWER